MIRRIGILSNTADLGVMAVRNLLIKLLREKHPDAHLSLVAEAEIIDRVRDFHQRASWVDECVAIEAERADTAAGRDRVRRQLDACGFDLFVLAPESKLPYAIPRRCGIPGRVGFSLDPRQRRHLTRVVEIDDPGDRDIHWTTIVDGYARALDLDHYRGAAAHVPFMRVNESLHPFGDSPGPRVAMHVGGNPEWNRRWPLRSFVELCRRLTGEARASVRLLGSRGEEPENRQIVETVRGENPDADIADASGCPVDETAACIADADLFVGNDSGPMNFAVARGTPIVAIRGADAENFRPDTVDGRHVVLSGWKQCSRYRNGSNVCQEGCPIAYDRLSQEYPKCMENISLQSVWTAVTRQLQTAAARSPA